MPLPNLEGFGGTLEHDHNIMSNKRKHALCLQCSQHARPCPALPCPAQWVLCQLSSSRYVFNVGNCFC